MISWYKNLYVDDVIKNKQKKIMKKMDKGDFTFSVYCVTLASNPSNLFDIVNANEFKWPYYQRSSLIILGLASGRTDAIKMVARIVEEIYNNTGGLEVRKYFGYTE